MLVSYKTKQRQRSNELDVFKVFFFFLMRRSPWAVGHDVFKVAAASHLNMSPPGYIASSLGVALFYEAIQWSPVPHLSLALAYLFLCWRKHLPNRHVSPMCVCTNIDGLGMMCHRKDENYQSLNSEDWRPKREEADDQCLWLERQVFPTSFIVIFLLQYSQLFVSLYSMILCSSQWA